MTIGDALYKIFSEYGWAVVVYLIAKAWQAAFNNYDIPDDITVRIKNDK